MNIYCRLIVVIILLITVEFTNAQPINESAGPKHVSSFEGGKLYRSGKMNVLALNGSYRQMGRQYGYLLSGELKGVHKNAVVGYFQQHKGLSADEMKQTALSLYRFYPQRFKDIIAGMAETSGLSLE
jgi:hypothetical protein